MPASWYESAFLLTLHPVTYPHCPVQALAGVLPYETLGSSKISRVSLYQIVDAMKILAFLIGFVLLIAAARCGQSGAANDATGLAVAALPDTLNLAYQDTLFLSAGKDWLLFDSLAHDSRCPTGATCVWEGNAKIGFSVFQDDDRHAFALNTHPNFQTDTTLAAWLSRRLRVVAPEHLAGPELAPKERSVWEGLLEGRLVASLPSEVEWEKAARGPDGKRRWPWPGDEPDPNRANYHDSGIDATSAVGCFPGGRSPFGAEEMSGNVWEWTRSLWGEKWNKPSFDYSYDPHDGREDEETPDAILRVLRGGAFNLNEDNVRCAFRDLYDPDDRSYRIGFRVFLRPRSIDESTDSEL